ncbi:MAG TPA: glutamine--fructose-6-phosphate transaminase (isomerizing) [Limnochordia bacterium]|nr:glutamine--fructose-6-phosphate transaminase (isomerizing) [Limnochordia bacterium]
MCGIVGYVGRAEAAPLLLHGLKKLEYRGYDSAGIAVVEPHLHIYKTQGRIADLEALLTEGVPPGSLGIGHTRWATHGRPSWENAHPHCDCSGQIAVVHNGIIENYLELRKKLEGEGHVFRSETDTEVVSHLVEKYYAGDLCRAVQAAVTQLKGSYALAVVSSRHPNELIAVRHDSPLVIGVGEGEYYLASDIPALLDFTRTAYILDDGQVARITRESVAVFNQHGAEQLPQTMHISWDPVQAEKEGYAHFMLKEIHEQPRAIRQTLAGRLGVGGALRLAEEIPADFVRGITNVHLIACGTAYHAALYGAYLLQECTDLQVHVELASEYRYKRTRVNDRTLAIAISQSGETADTLGAMRKAKAAGARILAITNVVGSTLAREADAVMYTHAGPEIAVASTKAYTAQLCSLCLLAAYLQQHSQGTYDPDLLRGLLEIPDQMASIFQTCEARIKEYSWERLAAVSDTIFLGRGLDLASAMEGQLKLKEIAYIHAEALAAGELKHGTLALIEPGVPVVALATQPHLLDKLLSNLREVKARHGEVFLIAMDRQRDFSQAADEVLLVPRTYPMLAPLLTVLPMQLMAYYTATARGCDVDKPRNLAKSVTVE